jgi:hypothetical protein
VPVKSLGHTQASKRWDSFSKAFPLSAAVLSELPLTTYRANSILVFTCSNAEIAIWPTGLDPRWLRISAHLPGEGEITFEPSVFVNDALISAVLATVLAR